jgi:hypothetical protein
VDLAPKIQSSRSAMTIESPIVTIVWRMSWPCMKRKMLTCMQADDRRAQEAARQRDHE